MSRHSKKFGGAESAIMCRGTWIIGETTVQRRAHALARGRDRWRRGGAHLDRDGDVMSRAVHVVDHLERRSDEPDEVLRRWTKVEEHLSHTQSHNATWSVKASWQAGI